MSRLDVADTPPEILEPVRTCAMALPEVEERPTPAVRQWLVRRRNFASLMTLMDERGENTILQFRSSGDEMHVLLSIGHPYFKAGWGENVLGMLVTANTDWEEVGELLTESYCIMAPKKLVALVQPPLA